MAGQRRKIAFVLCLAAATQGCSSERKLSHVETRFPAASSSRGDSLISPLRSRLSQTAEFPTSCPAEVHELLAPLSLEHVKFPPCPEELGKSFAAARPALSLEESTAVEELLNAQCRVNPREGLPDSLDSLLQDSARVRHGPRGDGFSEGAPASDGDAKLRERLRNALLDMRAAATPLDQWVRNNGDFVFPDEQLEFFERLVGKDACRMNDQEVDLSYRTLRNLEELTRIEAAGEPQRARIGKFLNGVHKVIDRKIREFFR